MPCLQRSLPLLMLALWVASSQAGEFDLQRFCEDRLSARESDLLADLADQELDSMPLLEAALVAGGNASNEIEGYRRRLSTSIADCRQKMPTDAGLEARLQTIFRHLSGEFFQGEYVPDLYDVGRTISAREFNCLTATIVFQTVCESLSIEVQPVWEPAHVRCWCPSSTRSGYRVETTATTVGMAVRPDETPGARLLTKSELLGKVFYNCGVRALQEKDFARAMSATWISSSLDPGDSSARSNLLAGFNNWALQAWQQNDLTRARNLLEQGLRLDPQYPPFSRNLARLIGTRESAK